MFIWEPIPSETAFIAVGYICTSSDDQPDPTSVRCIPRKWLTIQSEQENMVSTKLVWDGAGSPGAPGGLYRVSQLGLLVGVKGAGGPGDLIHRPKFQGED